MTRPHPPDPPSDARQPEQELMLVAGQVIGMVEMARALVCHQRHVDLGGLQDRVGLLCAKALDLPPDRTGLARSELMRLRDALDGLRHAMRENAV